jgi:sarcosine oxidase subunit alpha
MVDWPELDVTLTSVSDQWASLAITGPYARDLLSALKPDFDVLPAGLPFASVRIGHLYGYPVRVFGVSFSGELSYEINTPSGYADALLSMVMEHGKAWNITPYGLETLDVLRIEKGHLSIGTEIDGRRTADDLGLGKMLSRKKDFVGRALSQRPAMIAELDQNGCAESLGFLTAAIYSPVMDHYIALGFLKNGRQRIGDTVWAHSPIAGQSIRLKVTSSCFYDPEGVRYRA